MTTREKLQKPIKTELSHRQDNDICDTFRGKNLFLKINLLEVKWVDSRNGDRTKSSLWNGVLRN